MKSVKKSFYQRPLPSTCIAFSSPEGKRQFESALHHKGLKSFFALMEQFTTQSEPAYCGISTLVIILNALGVDPRKLWKGSWRWYHEDMLNCCVDLEEIKKAGITLNIFACLSKCQGLHVTKNFAQDRSLEDFRHAVNKACVESNNDNNESKDDDDGANQNSPSLLVVSYNRKILQQTGTGHFSPIAAFDPISDQVLILDTARFKYGAHWVPLPLLYEAMLPIDQNTGKSRGYVLLSYLEEEGERDGTILINLSTTTSSNYSDRQRYKKFIQSKQQKNSKDGITWNDTLNFWTKGGKKVDLVWKSLTPQLAPVDEKSRQAVDSLRILIQSLIVASGTELSSSRQYTSKCQSNSNRVISLYPEEAIFILYLASLPPQRRQNVIFCQSSKCNSDSCKEENDGGGDDDIMTKDLLMEVDMVHNLLEISAEMNEALEEQQVLEK